MGYHSSHRRSRNHGDTGVVVGLLVVGLFYLIYFCCKQCCRSEPNATSFEPSPITVTSAQYMPHTSGSNIARKDEYPNQDIVYPNENQGTVHPNFNQGNVYSNQGSAYPNSIQGSAYRNSNQGSAYPNSIQGSAYPNSNQGSTYPNSNEGSAYTNLNHSAYPNSNQGSAYLNSNQVGAYLCSNQGDAYPNSNQGAIYPNSNICALPNQVPYPMEQRGFEILQPAPYPSYTVPPGTLFPLIPSSDARHASGPSANENPPSYNQVLSTTTTTYNISTKQSAFNPSYRE